MINLKPFFSTVTMCAKKGFDGNFLEFFSRYIVRFLRMYLFILVWKSLYLKGSELGEMSVNALLTYTLLGSAFSAQFNIVTPATSALWQGSITGRYTRPANIISSLIWETIGNWTMPIICYTIPVIALSPLLGINPIPESLSLFVLFFISMAFSISLGFAIDFIFASVAIRLKNACWAAWEIKNALITLLSGAAIPFYLFPDTLEKILNLLPFGSVASAPLNIYVGAKDSVRLLLLQVFWNIILWTVSLTFFKKSEERMISYGG